MHTCYFCVFLFHIYNFLMLSGKRSIFIQHCLTGTRSIQKNLVLMQKDGSPSPQLRSSVCSLYHWEPEKPASFIPFVAGFLLTSYWLNSRKILSSFGNGSQADIYKVKAPLLSQQCINSVSSSPLFRKSPLLHYHCCPSFTSLFICCYLKWYPTMWHLQQAI